MSGHAANLALGAAIVIVVFSVFSSVFSYELEPEVPLMRHIVRGTGMVLGLAALSASCLFAAYLIVA